jgi:hypothetical protein
MAFIGLLDRSVNETVMFPEVAERVFPVSNFGGKLGVVYTFTVEGAVVTFPTGLDTLIYKEYVFATKGIRAFPVLFMVN